MEKVMNIDRNHSDAIYYRRVFAKSKLVLEVGKAGKMFSRTSLLSNKVDDTIRQYMQGGLSLNEFKYDNLSKLARKELEPVFERLGLNNPKNKEENRVSKRKKRIAISNWKEAYIEKNFQTAVRLNYDDFIMAVNANSLKKSVNDTLMILSKIQDLNKYEIEHPRLDLETGEIEIGISKVNALPRITLWLSDDFEGKGHTLESFAKLDIKNKKSFIKGLEFKFDTAYLFHVVGIGNDYTVSYRSKRDKLKWSVSHKLDIFINSIAIHKNNKNAMRFSVIEMKHILGAREEMEYKYFKRSYLTKPLQDINEAMGKNISFEEERVGRKVEYVIFKIENTDFDEFDNFKFDYISSQLYFFTNIEIQNIVKFKNFLKNKTFEESENIGDKEIEAWTEEAERAYLCEKEILELQKKSESFFIKKNLVYDVSKHTFLKDVAYLEDGETKHKYHLIDFGGKKITNPILSLEYIIELENQESGKSIHLLDFMPFAYATPDGKWIKIETLDDFENKKELLYKDVVLKNKESFAMESSELKSMFDIYVEKEMFTDINRSFTEKVKKLYGLN